MYDNSLMDFHLNIVIEENKETLLDKSLLVLLTQK